MLANTAILVTALLFGSMVLYSFGFAAFIFNNLPAELAGPTIRKAFPHFYVFVMATSLIAAVLLWSIDPTSAILIRMRGKPRPSDLVAQQPLGEADELGWGRIARTPSASFVG
jgi:hypothetical protein